MGFRSRGLPENLSAGVSKRNVELKMKVDQIIAGHRDEITRILDSYGVPRVEREEKIAKQ